MYTHITHTHIQVRGGAVMQVINVSTHTCVHPCVFMYTHITHTHTRVFDGAVMQVLESLRVHVYIHVSLCIHTLHAHIRMFVAAQ